MARVLESPRMACDASRASEGVVDRIVWSLTAIPSRRRSDSRRFGNKGDCNQQSTTDLPSDYAETVSAPTRDPEEQKGLTSVR